MNINEIKTNLLKEVKAFDVSEFAFNDVLRIINEKVIRDSIKKANVYNIKRHILESRNSSNNDEFKKAYSESLSFEDKQNYINELFARYTKEDKIKECLPHFDSSRLLNDTKEKYFSMYDYKKGKAAEEMIKDIKARISKLKEVRFMSSGLSDRYYKAERIKDLFEFLNFGYGFAFDLDLNQLYDLTTKQIEEHINQNGEVKIRMFKDFFYLSFKDEEKTNDLKNRVQTELLNRIARD